MSVVITPDIEHARRIAFTIAKAESRLGLTETKLPANDRLQAILSEAALRPADIDPDVYKLVYLFAQGRLQ